MQLIIDEAYELKTDIALEMNESTGNTEKNYYLEGIFSTPDKKNRNGRVYPRKVWEKALREWKEKVKNNPVNSLGEWEHPQRVQVDSMKAVIKILEMDFDGEHIMGRAKVLNNGSEVTNQIKALIDEGIKIGISTRGTGRMKGQVVEEFTLSTADLVESPSNYNSELTGISESIEKEVELTSSGWECKDGTCMFESGSESGSEKSKCQMNADSLLKSLKNVTEPEVQLSESEIKAIDLILKERRDKMTQEELTQEISKFEKMIKQALKDGAMYGNVNKLEKELKNIKDYAKNTGMTEKQNYSGYNFDLVDGTIIMSKDGKELLTKEYPSLTSVQAKKMIKEYEAKGLTESGTESDINDAIKTFWTGVNGLKKEIKDEKILKQFSHALSDVDDILDTLR